MSVEAKDTLTMFGEEPNMEALHREYDDAWANDEHVDTRLEMVERVRYMRWPGQDPDGLQHRDRYETEGRSVVWEGFPDTRIPMADDIINFIVALFVMSFWNAKLKTSPIVGKSLNAAQAGELYVVLNWLKNGVLKRQLLQNVEIAAQLTAMVGWCVLHPGWRNHKTTAQQKMTMDDVMRLARTAGKFDQATQGQVQQLTLLSSLPQIVMDPEMQDEAVEIFRTFFPDTDAQTARKHVKELRETGETEFPVEVTTTIGPQLGVLCPWYHFIMPLEGTARPEDARLMFVRMQIPIWRVDDLARAEEWDDQDFIEALKKTAGQSQQPPYTKEDDKDINRNLVDLVYAYRTVIKESGARSIWCTVMSPKVTGDKTTKRGAYGKNWELNLAHGRMPFLFPRMEAADWCITDTRGVCDVVATYQMEKKNFRDATYAYTQLNVTPPMQRMGTAASKAPPEFGPFAIINNVTGRPWERLDLTSGTNIEVPFKQQEIVQKEAEDYYGVPRGDTPPQKSQLKQQKLVNGFLGSMGEALDQLAVLTYQNMDPEELASIIGHKPLLDAATVARHQVMLSFDVRTGDGDFIDKMRGVIKDILSAGLGNDLLLNKVVEWMLNFLDPNAAAELLPQDQSPGRQAMKDARDELNNVMMGNPPMLVEKDPAAKQKLQYIQQLVQQNPRYQMKLSEKVGGQENPQFDPQVAENFQTMMKNLQHSYQETTLSKVQGRLGVKNVQGG